MKNKYRFFKVIILAVLAEIMFVTCTDIEIIVSLTISPTSAFITKGGTQNFTAAVTGGDIDFPKDVIWSVSGSSNPNTVINSAGVLTVAADESSLNLSVKAVSKFNNGITGTAAVLTAAAILLPLIEDTWADGNITSSSGEQWFSFTATSSTQYIHASFGTLTNLYVQLYDSNNKTVLSTYLSGTMSLTVTSGQVYYIRVSSSSSGTYRIAFNKSIIPKSIVPTQLIEGTWTDGNITTSGGEQWFKFTATASTQFIHASFGTLTNLHIQLYDSNNKTVGSSTNLSGSTIISRTVTSGQVYYIRVSSNSSGTYRIMHNTSIDATTLVEDTWADGNIASYGGEQWFKFTATSSTQFIHTSFGTLTSLYVQLYDSNNKTVGSLANLSGRTISISRTVTNGQVYYIRVWPFISSGTYRIAFNTSIIPTSIVPTQLIEDTWADGNIASYGGEQWFKFTATSSTQFIHASFGTLTSLYVLLYDSNYNTVGYYLSGSTISISRTVTSGQVYYISVWPYYSNSSGTYRIAFNASATAPPL